MEIGSLAYLVIAYTFGFYWGRHRGEKMISADELANKIVDRLSTEYDMTVQLNDDESGPKPNTRLSPRKPC